MAKTFEEHLTAIKEMASKSVTKEELSSAVTAAVDTKVAEVQTANQTAMDAFKADIMDKLVKLEAAIDGDDDAAVDQTIGDIKTTVDAGVDTAGTDSSGQTTDGATEGTNQGTDTTGNAA